jgi:hypothetical protein
VKSFCQDGSTPGAKLDFVIPGFGDGFGRHIKV